MEVLTTPKTRDDLWRWYPLKYHPTQYKLIHDGKRFPLVAAGRRSGKTEQAKRNLVKHAITQKTKWPINYYFASAPVFNQAKKIYWQDLQDLTRPWWRDKPSKTDNIIFTEYFGIKSEIHVLGLDKPERIEGSPWDGGIVDEYANVRPKAWIENIFPALGDRDGWCWRIGVPEGRNHYYTDSLDACDGIMPKVEPGIGAVAYSKTDPTAGFYAWHSADILSPDKMAAFTRKMDERTFQQEMEAEFLSYAGLLYYNFSEKNINDFIATYKDDEPIYLSCDFNKNPLCWGVAQFRDQLILVVDEINIHHNAKTQQAAEMFCNKYKDAKNRLVYLTGDASGNVETTHDYSTDYMIIEDVLKHNGFQVAWRVPRSNPNINNRVALVCSLIESITGKVGFYIRSTCSMAITDFNRVVGDGKGGKEKKNDKTLTHASDWIDYLVTCIAGDNMWGYETGQTKVY